MARFKVHSAISDSSFRLIINEILKKMQCDYKCELNHKNNCQQTNTSTIKAIVTATLIRLVWCEWMSFAAHLIAFAIMFSMFTSPIYIGHIFCVRFFSISFSFNQIVYVWTHWIKSFDVSSQTLWMGSIHFDSEITSWYKMKLDTAARNAVPSRVLKCVEKQISTFKINSFLLLINVFLLDFVRSSSALSTLVVENDVNIIISS